MYLLTYLLTYISVRFIVLAATMFMVNKDYQYCGPIICGRIARIGLRPSLHPQSRIE